MSFALLLFKKKNNNKHKSTHNIKSITKIGNETEFGDIKMPVCQR